MITPLLEDSIQAIESLNKTDLKISNELNEIAKILERLFNYNDIEKLQIIKEVESLRNLIVKTGEQKKH